MPTKLLYDQFMWPVIDIFIDFYKKSEKNCKKFVKLVQEKMIESLVERLFFSDKNLSSRSKSRIYYIIIT